MVRRDFRAMNEIQQAQSPIYEFSGFRLDVARRQLRAQDDQPAGLTVKVFDILLYLVEHHGELVDKSTLMQAVWPNVIVEENNLNQNISVLRKVLGERAGEHRFIVTVPGRGFRFVAPVTVASGYGQARSAPVAPATSQSPRIAIMPFENLSPDPANAFFADGLHDEILATLAQRAPGLQVISRTTMMRYRAHPAPLPQIAAELNANFVVEGTVRREADQVRVTLQLIDARDDRHLWAQSYDRTLKSALTLQCEVASDVATRLAARFVGDTGAAPTNNPEAYDLYLRSRLQSQLLTPLTPVERYDDVEAMINRALELDPDFALAYALRAGFSDAKFGFNYDTSDDLLQRIRTDLATAKRLAPGNPFVLGAEAGHLTWIEADLPRALATFDAAKAAGLTDPMLLTSCGSVLIRLGRADEAVVIMEGALARDPGNPFLLSAAALQTASAHRPAEAVRMIDGGLALHPGWDFLKLVRAQIVFLHTGRFEDLRRELARATTQLPLPSLLDLAFFSLMSVRAFDDLHRMLDAIPDREVRAVPGPGGGGPMFGVGSRPMAQFRGLLALVRGDAAEAARQGAEVLDFVARRKVTPQNAWFLHWLRSDGHMMLGQREPAIAAARAATAARPIARDRFGLFPALPVVRNLAWCGAQDEAMNLLEKIVELRAYSGAATIALNSTLKTALAGNARFATLLTKVEAEMRATHLE
jgi:TolB-like protein